MCSKKSNADGCNENPATELSKEEIALVHGAGDLDAFDPFENEPRVPVAPIDPEIREDL